MKINRIGKIVSRLLICFIAVLLSTCAQYRGRTLVLKFINDKKLTTGTNVDPYATGSMSFSGEYVFEGVKETDTLLDVFRREAEKKGLVNPDEQGFGPWAWGSSEIVNISEDQENYFTIGFDVMIDVESGDERHYRFNWPRSQSASLENLRFSRDTARNNFTIGINENERVGDAVAIYPLYESNISKKSGEFYVLDFVQTTKDGDLQPALERFSITTSEFDPNYYIVPRDLLSRSDPKSSVAVLGGRSGTESGFLIDSTTGYTLYNRVTSDRNAQEGTPEKELYDILSGMYGSSDELNSSKFQNITDYGFKYTKIFTDKKINPNTNPNNARRAYPVYRTKDNMPVQEGSSFATNDINESDQSYYFFFNEFSHEGMLTQDNLPTDDPLQARKDSNGNIIHYAQYYVLKPDKTPTDSADQNANPFTKTNLTQKNLYSRLFDSSNLSFASGYTLEMDRKDPSKPRIITSGEKILIEVAKLGSTKAGEEADPLNGRILIPKYSMPYIDITLDFNISPIDVSDDGLDTYGHAKHTGKNGMPLTIANQVNIIHGTGDPAIDDKGYPKIIKSVTDATSDTDFVNVNTVNSAVITVRAGESMKNIRKKIVDRISELPSDMGKGGKVDGSGNEILDKDRKIYWPVDVDPLSYLINGVGIKDFPTLVRKDLEIKSYDFLDNSMKDNVWYTYDFARELMYGYRDYSDHGKRYYFNLRKQRTPHEKTLDGFGNESTGGEWEIKGLKSGEWVDKDGKKGTTYNSGFARSIKGDDYLFYVNSTIRPHYIDAGYAPIARQVVFPEKGSVENWVPTSTDGFSNKTMDDRRRTDVFANFIYIPGSEYKQPVLPSIDDVMKKWGLRIGLDFNRFYKEYNLGYTVLNTETFIEFKESDELVTMKPFEAMEIPLTHGLLYSMGWEKSEDGKDYRHKGADQTAGTMLKHQTYLSKDANIKSLSTIVGRKVDYSFSNDVDQKGEDFPDLGGSGNYSQVISAWGQKQDRQPLFQEDAVRICNAMTAAYNEAYGAHLYNAYDNNGKLLPQALTSSDYGFRLPTAYENEYMNRIITQEQQIVPSDVSGVEVRKVGGETYSIVTALNYNDKTSDGYMTTHNRNAFEDGRSTGGYYFQSLNSLPGLMLKNYDKDTSSTYSDSDFISEGLKGTDKRSYYDVQTVRYDTFSDFANLNFQYAWVSPTAKLTLNTRSGCGLMDSVSCYMLLEKTDAATSAWLKRFFTDYRGLFDARGELKNSVKSADPSLAKYQSYTFKDALSARYPGCWDDFNNQPTGGVGRDYAFYAGIDPYCSANPSDWVTHLGENTIDVDVFNASVYLDVFKGLESGHDGAFALHAYYYGEQNTSRVNFWTYANSTVPTTFRAVRTLSK